jgi:hypothetical protein
MLKLKEKKNRKNLERKDGFNKQKNGFTNPFETWANGK